ncbi:hypothetical protein FN846DRAFT_901795 [Sphaerosporella brunnea]|uniref:Uncharacterized protein n=1 Tax=Sphaerosporella brunnea TaxID=1250544 RepID=A0A5J5FBG6_9PEZI|nr:hypothetical protein FN846DRAFT_901795 [Sphaerosporella brunnea]
MFAVRLAPNTLPYPQHPASVTQWMAAVEHIWVAAARGFFGHEVPPRMRFRQDVNLVVVLALYMHAVNAGRPTPRSINFRFSTEVADTQSDWRATGCTDGGHTPAWRGRLLDVRFAPDDERRQLVPAPEIPGVGEEEEEEIGQHEVEDDERGEARQAQEQKWARVSGPKRIQISK